MDSRATDVKNESGAKQAPKKLEALKDEMVMMGFSASFSSSLKQRDGEKLPPTTLDEDDEEYSEEKKNSIVGA